MFGHTFYHNVIRKYIILFGTLFNDIHITRSNSSGTQIDLIKVPLSYAPKEKILSRVDADPDIDRQAAVVLPRLAFEMQSMEYDGTRKLPTTIKRVTADADYPSKLTYQYVPVPYNLKFKLYIFVKNAEDGTKIVEQILPFFTPDWTSTIELIPEMSITADIPIVLNSIDTEDSYTGNFETRRSLIWTLDFTLKGYVYGPVRKTGIIKFANTNFYAPSSSVMNANGDLTSAVGNSNPEERVTVRPGLTANGTPTSNLSLSVALSDIEATDNWGYIITTEGLLTQ